MAQRKQLTVEIEDFKGKKEKGVEYIIDNTEIKVGDTVIYKTASGIWRLYGEIKSPKVQSANKDKDYYKAVAKVGKNKTSVYRIY